MSDSVPMARDREEAIDNPLVTLEMRFADGTLAVVRRRIRSELLYDDPDLARAAVRFAAREEILRTNYTNESETPPTERWSVGEVVTDAFIRNLPLAHDWPIDAPPPVLT